VYCISKENVRLVISTGVIYHRSTKTYLHIANVAKWLLFTYLSLQAPFSLHSWLIHLPDEQLHDMLQICCLWHCVIEPTINTSTGWATTWYVALGPSKAAFIFSCFTRRPLGVCIACIGCTSFSHIKRSVCDSCEDMSRGRDYHSSTLITHFFDGGGPIRLFIRCIIRNEVWVKRIRSFHIVFLFCFFVETLVLFPSWHFYVEIRLLTWREIRFQRNGKRL
jgi:hypothetical protein